MRRYLLAFVLVFATSGMAAAQRTRGRQAQPAKTYTSIRQVDFNNFTYRWPGGDDSITLKNGSAVWGESDASLEAPAYGDLTGDGVEDAAFVIWLRNHNSARYEDSACFIYTLRGGKPSEVANLPGAMSARIIGRRLIIEENVSGNNMVVPNKRTYQWERGRLVKVAIGRK